MDNNDNIPEINSSPDLKEAMPQQPKRKSQTKLILLFVFVFLAGGFIGWRVMVRVWPVIKPAIMTNIVYKIIPSLEPEAKIVEPELYTARSTAATSDKFGPTDTVIYYLYKDYCPYCKAISPLFDEMPDIIRLADGTESKVYIIAIEKQTEEGLALCEYYYENFSITEDERYVPALVIGSTYLFGSNEIMGGLYPAILSGEGLKTPMLGDNTRS